jgi:hypothetical protein
LVVVATDALAEFFPAEDGSHASSRDRSDPSPFSKERDAMAAMFRSVWRTWMDWMLHYDSWGVSAVDKRIRAIGSKLWNATAENAEVETMAISLDPCARWLSSWMGVLCHPVDILEWLSNGDATAAAAQNLLSKAWRRRLLPIAGQPIHSNNLPAFCYWLSVFRSLLVHLRVLHFPWKHMVELTVNPSLVDAGDDDGDKIQLLAGLYLRLLGVLRPLDSEGLMDHATASSATRSANTETCASTRLAPMQEMCIDALETLLSGCHAQGGYHSTFRAVRLLIQNESSHPTMQVLDALVLQHAELPSPENDEASAANTP